MEKILEQSLLYDFYGEMLTDHQKAIYEDYVLNDLSLGEIAAERQISRQGVYDIVKRCNRQLASYEEKLKLLEKFIAARQKVEEINQYAHLILNEHEDRNKMVDYVKHIEALSNQIIEEM